MACYIPHGIASARQAVTRFWIAEDDEYVRLALARAFRGCCTWVRPLFFTDGAALVEHCGSNCLCRPNFIVLDLQMPLLDGLSALRTLQHSSSLSETPRVIFSSNDEPETVRTAYAAGAALYLKKPHRLEEFNDVARLCATCLDRNPGLTRSLATLGALDAREAVKLFCIAHENSALSHPL